MFGGEDGNIGVGQIKKGSTDRLRRFDFSIVVYIFIFVNSFDVVKFL